MATAMNLHDLDPDYLMEYMSIRYSTYVFERAGPESIRYRYHDGTVWDILNEANYRDFLAQAQTWRRERIP